MPSNRSYRLSVLDISPVSTGSSSAAALRNTLDLAVLAERLGYTRYWVAEHHNSALIASSAPAVIIAHIADVTTSMRVGSGGVMLPNHSPLSVAESFRALEAFHPGRIDLGLGRAPGTNPMTALALRRSREALSADDFPQQLQELLGFLTGEFPDDHPFKNIIVMPTDVPPPDIWLLGSSYFSAQLAASLGLPFAFAHHIEPGPAIAALQLYRQSFRPSRFLQAPKSLIAISAICADTDEKAREVALPAQLRLLQRRQGKWQPLPSIADAKAYPYTAEDREIIEIESERLFIGAPSTLLEQISALAEQAAVEEIMITTLIHDHSDRRRSYELLADAFAISPTAHATAKSI